MRKTLSKSEIKELNEKINQRYAVALLSKKDFVENVDDTFIMVNKEPYFFFYENELIPTLKLILKNPFLKKITVDMGAVKFIVNGADIMRPGVTDVEDGINEGDFVIVQDIDNKKPLAIGRALFNSEDMRNQESGKVIKNIHKVGDDIWNA